MSDPVKPLPALSHRRSWTNTLASRAQLWSMLYLLMIPTVVGVLLFTYYPNIEVVKYAFYRWDGSQVEEYRGLENFKQAVGGGDPMFWNSFQLVGILLIANLLKMWPSIFVAIALHRLNSQRWQYIYRVAFVIPMVIPGLVWLLIWKTIFTTGMLNDVFNALGIMSVLQGLNNVLPAASQAVNGMGYQWDPSHPVLSTLLSPIRLLPLLFGSAWGLGLFAFALFAASGGLATIRRRWPAWAVIALLGSLIWGPSAGDNAVGAAWGTLRGMVLPVLAIGIGEWLVKRDRILAPGRTFWCGIAALGLAAAVILGTQVWTEHIKAFDDGTPPWLGHSKLVIPAIIMWGFPWVGTIGVLIYLAGLQGISTEVYEAAELDGVGFWGKIFRIELPLIMTQVRINLIFMTIGTLTDYAFLLLLLGPYGGSGNAGMVPGLYMYNKAFLQNEYGYACTLGLCLFVIVLGLTVVYQKYVKVEK